MDRKELSKLFYLNKEITRDTERLLELKAKAEGKSQPLTGMPHVQGISNNTALAAEIADIRQEIESKKQLTVIEFNRLNRYINTIDDAQIRLIMKYRHLDLFSWNKVADQIGGGNTEDSVRMIHDRFLRRH